MTFCQIVMPLKWWLYKSADDLVKCHAQNNGQTWVNRFDGVIVSTFASSAVDRVFEPRSVKPKTIALEFVASPLSTQH